MTGWDWLLVAVWVGISLAGLCAHCHRKGFAAGYQLGRLVERDAERLRKELAEEADRKWVRAMSEQFEQRIQRLRAKRPEWN